MRTAPIRRGFTLIEVLVVVAIIALLIAILLPSLQRARKYARSAVCLAHLMSIGSGMKMYQADFRGWLPVGPADKLWWYDVAQRRLYYDPGPGRRPYPWSNCHWGGKRAAYIHDIEHNPPQPEVLRRPLTNYLYRGAGLDQPTPLFECPDDVGTPLWDNPVGAYPIYYLCGNSYYTNPWSTYQQVGSRRLKITSMIVLIEEASMFFGFAEYPQQQVNGWHGRFSTHNMLFLDFHAESKFVDTRQYYGPGWFVENYFDIMDYYKY
jgi:prepilin-type N-terminal cleavage/methylation domain-containing protein